MTFKIFHSIKTILKINVKLNHTLSDYDEFNHSIKLPSTNWESFSCPNIGLWSHRNVPRTNRRFSRIYHHLPLVCSFIIMNWYLDTLIGYRQIIALFSSNGKLIINVCCTFNFSRENTFELLKPRNATLKWVWSIDDDWQFGQRTKTCFACQIWPNLRCTCDFPLSPFLKNKAGKIKSFSLQWILR